MGVESGRPAGSGHRKGRRRWPLRAYAAGLAVLFVLGAAGNAAALVVGHEPDSVLVPLSIGLLLAYVAATVAVVRAMSRPVARLSAQVRDVTTHKSQGPVPAGGPAEVAALAAAINGLITAARAESATLARFAAIVESSDDAIIGKTLDGIVTDWNKAAENQYGYTAGEMIGRSVLRLFPPGREGELDPILDRVRRGERVTQLDTQRVRKDGTVLDVSVSVSPIRDATGTVTGATTVARDVTERNQAARAVREAQQSLAAVVESSADAIIGTDANGTITSWNAAATEMYLYTAQEMIGQNISQLFPPGNEGGLSPVTERVHRGARVTHFETQRVRKDGTVLDVSMSASPIRDATGTVTGVAAVVRDMTERNQALAEREASEARLHQAERMETVGQLAGGIAHDFNNLLAAITGYAGLVQQESSDPALRADMEQILTAAERGATLTRELLVFSRRDPAESGDLDLNAVIAGLRDMLRVSLGEHIEVHFRPAAALPPVRVARGHAEQSLLNLAVNARDAMPEGGRLTIGTGVTDLPVGDPRLAPGTEPGRFVELAIADTGTGMSPEVTKRIFEPFYTTKPVGKGTGLGLFTVYGIVTAAGGCLSVDSVEGAGTTFRLYFPAAARVAARTAGAPPAASRDGLQGRGETVLVVDDEPSVLTVTARILRRNGYATLEASTWQQALSLVSPSSDLKLLLTDSVMPGMSGDALAGRIRESHPALRVLRMSGYPGGTASPAGPDDEVHGFLRKPFTAETLLAKIRAALDTPPPG